MESLLNRPIWTALTTRQKHLALSHGLARRFDPETSPFAASQDDTTANLRALDMLVHDRDDRIVFLQTDPVQLPDTLAPEQAADGVQMVLHKDLPEVTTTDRIERLSEGDIPDMIALAALTKPGPFKSRTFELGEFWGVKINGRLAAMTGERLNLPGFTEVSGVCTHPDFRGRGLAAALSVHVARRILARGDTPFLHAYTSNLGAIDLYERLGFEKRADVHVVVACRAE
ncbi:GNAT family N-acetyltransferase [Roseibium sp.]|uniref:GNAT family N-acetyltransferase n=1 Tax=Roseibium sp. TaxID=1936156 RepID=UPI003A980A32